MKVNHSILILFVIFIRYEFAHSEELKDDDECEEVFKKFPHPSSCCDYPQREIPASIQEQCKHFCSDIKDHAARGCCLINCNYHKSGVFANGKFNAKSLMQLYENYLNEHGGGKYDSWAEIIEQSVDACRNLVKNSDEIYACDVPTYVIDIMDCVDYFNFMNCSNFRMTDMQCLGLKIFVGTQKKCGKQINGTFIIDHRFFKMVSTKVGE